MKSNKVVLGRMMRAYRMMLDFFGIRLQDEASGKLQRAKQWKARMAQLNQFVSLLFITATAHMKVMCKSKFTSERYPVLIIWTDISLTVY